MIKLRLGLKEPEKASGNIEPLRNLRNLERHLVILDLRFTI
jgi:hypothetical protein